MSPAHIIGLGGGEVDEDEDVSGRSSTGRSDDSIRLGTPERLDVTGGRMASLGPEDNPIEEGGRVEAARERIAGEKDPKRLSSSSLAKTAGDRGKAGKSRTESDDTALLESSVTDTGEERRVTVGGKAGSKGVGGKDSTDEMTEGGRGIF